MSKILLNCQNFDENRHVGAPFAQRTPSPSGFSNPHDVKAPFNLSHVHWIFIYVIFILMVKGMV